ncbi:MAG: head GIN domain-containing protein [Hyphomonadaceae bacterium]
MRIVAACFAAAIVLAAAAPASAEVRTVNAAPFTAIDASGPYRVNFLPGETHSVRLEGTQRNLDRTRVDVRNGVLRISQRCNFFCNSIGTLATINVTAPALSRAEASMGVDVRASGIAAERFTAEASMGGELRLEGECGDLRAEASMGGMLEATGLRCRTASADASMGGSVEISASQSVNAEASMGGEVEVAGGPQQRTTASTMGGMISVR